MPDREEEGGELHQSLGVLMKWDPVVSQAVGEGAERDTIRIVGSGIRLQPVHGPRVVEHEACKLHVRATDSAVGHVVFVFFLSYLRKE